MKTKYYKGGKADGGIIYVLGFVGSLIYFMTTAGSFTAGIVGVLKSLVWPGFLVYYLLQFLGV